MLAAMAEVSPAPNIAAWAAASESGALVGAAPGEGDLRLKSGGITSAALVVTANSSGDFLVRPADSFRDWQPAKAAARSRRQSAGLRMGRTLRRPQHVIDECHRPQRHGDIGDIKDIPVKAEGI